MPFRTEEGDPAPLDAKPEAGAKQTAYSGQAR